MPRKRKKKNRKTGISHSSGCSGLIVGAVFLLVGIILGIGRYPGKAADLAGGLSRQFARLEQHLRTMERTAPTKVNEPPLEVSFPAPAKSQYDNLDYGVPGPADTIIDREGYALGYIEYHEQPAWVTYKLTRAEVQNKAVKRGKDFREDPDIPTGSATLDDYRNSGYDRGHLAPSGDMTWSAKANSESFLLSNMSPQDRAFNAGLWNKLEEWVRSAAVREEEIQVVTGPILPKVKTKTIGANKVTVPDYYYKVILDLTPPCKAIGFIMPNQNQKKPLGAYAVTVDEVERQTGLDFFSKLNADLQDSLESRIDLKAWGL